MEYENGDRGAAVARLRELIEREPHDSLAHVALAAHYLREARLEATAAGRERRLEVARLLLEETVTNDPSDVAANMLMGDTLAALGQVSRARESYRRALERAPDDIATLMALARLDRDEGEYGGASMWAQRVLHIDPDHLGAHLVLVGALEAQGQLERATFHLWKARELDRDSPPKVSREEYQRRLLRFYEELSEHERSGGNY
jgi:Flp pilus assembly protein TadD